MSRWDDPDWDYGEDWPDQDAELESELESLDEAWLLSEDGDVWERDEWGELPTT